MHAVATFFASIIAFVSGFFAPTVASNSPVDVRTTQPAAAAAAQTEVTGNPFNAPAAASAVAESIPAPAPVFSPPPAQTVINQPVIERIIERIVPQGGTISAETLTAILADFERSISSRIAALNPPPAAIPAQVAAGGNAGSYNFSPASQRIDQLTNTAINTPTITGGTISGASVSGYLPLSGGTLTGTLSGTDLNLSGNLTAGTLSVAGLSSGGALFAPYFSATSTTATSTFAGGLTAASSSFNILQNGNVGMGTAAPSIAGVNSNSRVLSIVGDGTLVNARGVLELANPRASGSLAANDTAGSSFFIMSNNSGSPYIAGVLGSLSGSGGANGFGGKLQFQTKSDNNASSATTKMVLDQNGSLGIGTTTPWGKLSITGSGTGTGLAFAVADSANTPRLVIQDNGNIGIGTTTPLSEIEIYTVSGDSAEIRMRTDDDIAGGFEIGNSYNNTSTWIWNYENTPLRLATNNIERVRITADGNMGLGTTTPWGKLSITGSGTGTGLAFAVADSANTPRFVIQDNGNVGIGTTSPSSALSVNGFINVDGTAGGYKIDGNLVLYASTTNLSTAVGASGAAGWMSATSSPFYSTAVGYLALNTTPTSGTATHNTAIGRNALYSNTTGSYNTASGVNALQNNISGISNTASGVNALYSNTTGSNNIANGSSALFYNSSATSTVAIGYSAAVGTAAYSNQGGTVVGYVAGRSFTTGSDYNTLLGYQSGYGVTTGARNVLLGHSTIAASFNQVTTGSNNIAIGNDVAVASSTLSNQLVIGNLIYGTGLSGTGATVSTGNVGIGTTTPQAKLSVSNTTGGSALDLDFSSSVYGIRFQRNGQDMGSIYKNVSGPLNFSSYATQGTTADFSFMGGNVGIGSTTPSTKLVVYNAASGGAPDSNAFLAVENSGHSFINLLGGATAEVGLYLGNSTSNKLGRIFYNGSNSTLNFGNNTNSNMVISSAGNVGIGTTTPGSILHLESSLPILSLNTNTSGNSARINFRSNNALTSVITADFTDNSLQFFNNGAVRLYIGNTGNVGVGTTTPQQKLAISSSGDTRLVIDSSGSGSQSILSFQNQGAAKFEIKNQPSGGTQFLSVGRYGANDLNLDNNGNVGIGTTTPSDKLTVGGNVGITAASYPTLYFTQTNTDKKWLWSIGGSGSQTDGFYIQENVGGAIRLLMQSTTGYLGLGTTSPTAQLHTTGTVRFSNFGAGTLTTDASGNLSVSSDERLKNIDGEFTRGLADIVQLNPISYHWNATSGLDTTTQYAGFSAQNVQTAIPEAVGSSTNGYLTLQDRPLIATVVNAIKELAQQVSDLAERVTTKQLTFVRGEADDLTLNNKLCIKNSAGANVCITGDQLTALLSQSAAANLPPSVIQTSATNSPESVLSPIIEINGNATSTIELGDTYNDLGARIVAPTSDLNLGIVTMLDGATTTQVSIDTSAPGEHTIVYTVSSPTSGLTGSAMRTVIIAPAEQAQEPPSPEPANDNPFNLAPVNDNATSTTAVDTAA